MSTSKTSFVEFHDSRVVGICQGLGEISIHLAHAYVYEFEATPFEEPGIGLSQKARLLLTGVSESSIPNLDIQDEGDFVDIWRGTIWVNEEPNLNVIELPLNIQSAKIRIELRFNDGEEFHASCTGISYEGLSEPTFVERYRA